jgi:opacity protein-like surface antigen
MKKCFAVMLVFCSVCFPAIADAAAGTPADNFAMFKLGYMNPSITIYNPKGDNIDINPGAYYELSYTRRFGAFGVRGALGYAQNSCDKSMEYENRFRENYKADLYSVNAPVTFMYIYSSKIIDFYAGAGPGVYYRKMKIEYSNRSYDESVNSTSFNIGVQGIVGIDFRVFKNLAVGADIEYNLFRVKFNDDYSDNNTTAEFNPSFSISYSF